MRIKILQWNTWYKEDMENKISFLREINADIYCLQELNENNNEYNSIKSELNLNGYLGTTNTTHGEQGNAILTRYPIVRSKTSYIKQSKEPINTFSDEARIYIESRININEKTITVGTTHMSYTKAFKENDAKKEESRNLLTQIRKNISSYVFTGDINLVEDSELVNILGKSLKHTGPVFTEKTWTTKEFDYDCFKADSLDYRLDYVFTTNDINIISSEILNTQFSDHLPILVEIEI